MSVLINLNEDLARRLQDLADDQDTSVEELAISLLDDAVAEVPLAEMTETDLLLQATRGLPEPIWERYHKLQELRRNEQLDATSHEELKKLASLVESAHVRRLKFVAELAHRKEVDILEMMDELGIGQFDA
ncbi:MAG: hypothetical protein CMJ78_22120 [Planctomycetaceae bacterium]|nr:hypothetical protein [Planctomycetaceae bacterium]